MRSGKQHFNTLIKKRGIHKMVYDLTVVSGANNLVATGKHTFGPTDITNPDRQGLIFEISDFVVNTSIPGDTGNDRARITFNFKLNNPSSRLVSFEINNYINVT